MSPLLDVRDLQVEFRTEAGDLRAVDGVSFSVDDGEVFAIVGESGCGKTVTSLAIMGLVPKPAGRITGGSVKLRDEDLRAASRTRLEELRGDRMTMVFQDPLTALNPTHSVGAQIAELYEVHRGLSRREAWGHAVDALGVVGIPRPVDRSHDYPHQFSGGMRQRVMIAIAIALQPDLLIADEPTTALDVTIQAQILELLLEVRERFGMAIVLITHDLAIVAGTADRVMVMYAGKKVEEAPARELFARPKHPYTWGLLASTTRIDRPRPGRMAQIAGAPPSLLRPPPACRFAARCPYVLDVCRNDYPDLRTVGDTHEAACHFAQEPGWDPAVPGETA